MISQALPSEPTAAGLGAAAPSGSVGTKPLFELTRAVILVGLCLGLAMGWPKLVAVWQSQAFVDPDDAMQLVVVRDWLAGQAWFDLIAHRIDPPQGVLMHWSRIVELPLALLVRCFALFATQDVAERLMRIVYSLLLQAALFAVMVSVTRKLVGKGGIAVAVVLAAFSFAVAVQFPVGRIAHHNAQIVLLMLMLDATIDALDPRRAWSGALAGFWAALSLAISLENLPFVVAMLASFGVAWAVRGAPLAGALAWLGGSFAVSASVAFVATVPPERYAADVCDAFSGAYLIAAAGGGIGLLILAAATRRLPATAWRLAAAAAAGGLVLAAVAVAFPHCMREPFAGVDPLVHEVWVENVTEAQPLAWLLRSKTLATLPMALPIFLGLGLACLAAWRETAVSRARWLTVAAFAAVGVLGAFWEIRVATSAAPITVLGGAWLFVQARRWPLPRARAFLIVPGLLMLPLVPFAWALALPDPERKMPQPYGDPQACFESAAFSALDVLPPSLVLAPIDAASYILAFTPHAVIAAPYHRSNHGNRLGIEAFIGDPETARKLVDASGARYVAICPAADELSIYAARAPGGLATLLRDGAPPPWLRPVEVSGTPYRVYEIRR